MGSGLGDCWCWGDRGMLEVKVKLSQRLLISYYTSTQRDLGSSLKSIRQGFVGCCLCLIKYSMARLGLSWHKSLSRLIKTNKFITIFNQKNHNHNFLHWLFTIFTILEVSEQFDPTISLCKNIALKENQYSRAFRPKSTAEPILISLRFCTMDI